MFSYNHFPNTDKNQAYHENYAPPPPYHVMPECIERPEPSAPMEEKPLSSLHFSYENIVNWWNALSANERDIMKYHEKHLLSDKHALSAMRTNYQAYYPHEYFPKKIITENTLSVSDYYIIYFFADQLRQTHPIWFNESVYAAFSVKPPSYDSLDQPPSYEEALTWWEKLSQSKKLALSQKPISTQQVLWIHQENKPYYRSYCPTYTYNTSTLNFYDYYLMSRYHHRYHCCGYWSAEDHLLYTGLRASMEASCLAIKGTYNLAHHTAPLIKSGLSAIGKSISSAATTSSNFLSELGNSILPDSKSSSKEKEDTGIIAIFLGLSVLAGIAITACSAVIASAYAGIKSARSIHNLIHFKKIGASLWRLACMTCGAYVGISQGIKIGASIGSIIPGVGSIVGAVLGGIFGGAITAALGVAFGKYSLQAIIHYQHRNDKDQLPSGNPVKWNVNQIEKALRQHNHPMNKSDIRNLLTNIRQEKNIFKTMRGSIQGTEDNINKNKYNKLLDAIKMGKNPCDYVRVDQHTRFLWNPTQLKLTKESVEMPQPIGLSL